MHAWNRVPYAYTHFVRRLLAVAATAYYDDFQTGGPAYDQPSAQWAQDQLLTAMLGLGFDVAKHKAGVAVSVNLGVQTDFTSVVPSASLEAGERSTYLPYVLVGVTADRRKKLLSLALEILERRSLSHAAALKLYGMARFTVCPVFGRLGLGLLHRLPSVRGVVSVLPGDPIWEDLSALVSLLPRMRDVEYPLLPRRDAAVIVLTDASEVGGVGEVGVVLFDPVSGTHFAAGCVLPPWVREVLASLRRKQRYITQFEQVAALCAYLTFPDVLRGRLVHHFIDNEGARAGIVKGSSNKPDSARIIDALHVELVALSCQPWFSFVYSEDNLADDPSRGVWDRLCMLRALVRDVVLPPLAGWASAE